MLVRETSPANGALEPADGIYDEVYNWAVYQSGGTLISMFSDCGLTMNRFKYPLKWENMNRGSYSLKKSHDALSTSHVS